MSDLDELQTEIHQLQDKLSQDLDGLKNKDPSQRLVHLNRCQNRLITIRTKIEALDLEILQLDRNAQIPYKDSIKQLQTRFKDLKKQLDSKKAEKAENPANLTEEAMSKNLDDMTGQELIQAGDKYQEKGMDALNRIMGNIRSADEKADHINLAIYQQDEQIQRTKDKTQDVRSQLKKARTYLKYFAKQYYTDKLLMCFVLLAIIAIIVIIALKIAKDGKIPAAKDLIKSTTP